MYKPVPFKMLYRYKVGIFAGIVASITLLLVYVTGPRTVKGPQIRVLYISFSDYEAAKRYLTTTPFTIDNSVEILKISENRTVTIDRDEFDLKSTEESFYQANIVLECTSTFPTTWKYYGYGAPSVTEKNTRIHGDFNDSNTFSYLSLLNLMPLSEKTTGLYICSGVSKETSSSSTSVHLFVPGESTFIINYDTTVDGPGGDEVFVPCPVANMSATVSLYFKNQRVLQDDSDNLLSFDPKTGFTLKPKFIEHSDPWGDFYCKDEETGGKSGIVTIQPIKGLIVHVIPESDTVLLSKSSKDPKDKLKFICEAKEEITLKFLRVVSNPMVQYEYNSSSEFPFSAYTEVSPSSFKNLSKIYCRAVRSNEDLHSWKILFSSLPMRSELVDFNYDPSREDFTCCSPSNKKAKLTLISCSSISECIIKGHCLLPGRKCNPEKITVLPERTGCVRHKLTKDDKVDDGISSLSGLLQCSIDGKSVERIFFASRNRLGNNGTQLKVIFGSAGEIASESGDFRIFSTPDPGSILEIKELTKSSNSSRRRFICRGTKFFLAGGFVWQTVHIGNQIKYHTGRDSVENFPVMSSISLEISNYGVNEIKKIYCIAPLWNSDGEWLHAKLDLN